MRHTYRFQNTVRLSSYAKINLSLDVLGKMENGYHRLCMIMQTVSLRDEIQVTKTQQPGKISLSCPNPYVPENEKNIAWKAARLILDTYPERTRGAGLDIQIQKRIPVAAGLAGGSGNAAAVLLAANRLFRLSLPPKTLSALGLTLGADVPYCLAGGTRLSEGIGEILTPLPPFPSLPIVLVNPGKPLSTKAVFSAISDFSALPHPDTPALLEALRSRDVPTFLAHTANALEVPAIQALPEIAAIKAFLTQNGAIGAMMSGSGPTVFGIFDRKEPAQAVVSACRAQGYLAYLTYPVPGNRPVAV